MGTDSKLHIAREHATRSMRRWHCSRPGSGGAVRQGFPASWVRDWIRRSRSIPASVTCLDHQSVCAAVSETGRACRS